MAKKTPCWEGYEAIGMKEKDGRKVPNCVPKKETKMKKKAKGYKCGGSVKKGYKSGGMVGTCRGMGKASKGGKYKK